MPTSLIEDQLDGLAEDKVYCTLDMENGYFHVPIEEKSTKYIAFVTPDGQFEFLVVPMEMDNSAIFQRHVRAIFRELARKKIISIYFDDFIIPAKTEEECLNKLESVLNGA